MYTDNNLRVSGSRTAAAAAFADGSPSGYPVGDAVLDTEVSGDTIDLLQAREIGEGRDLYMVFTITEDYDGTPETVTFQAVIDTVANLASPTVLVQSPAIDKAELVVGKQVALRLPPNIGDLGQRYLGANYVFSAASTTGQIVADVVMDIQDGLKFYDTNIVVE